ncbi:ABC transporter ATP-binding protein [Pseudomonas sp. NCHU5208]|uniref:ABC transporter ATP-binding protein n=1 Tax=unclassified Pseudomonas TaxID=196821 RepID=UPI003F9997F8
MKRVLWNLSRPLRPAIALAACGQLALSACNAGLALCLAWALAGLFDGRPLASLWPPLGAFLGLTLLRIALNGGAEVLTMRAAALARQHLREPLLPQVLRVSGQAAGERDSAELSTTLIHNVEALQAYYSRYVPAVLGAALGGGGLLLLMAQFDPRSALVAALGALSLPVVDRLWLRWRRPSAGGLFASIGRFSAHLLDSLRGVTTLKAFNAQDRRRDALRQQAQALRQQAMAVLHGILMRNGATGLLSLGGLALVTLLSVAQARAGELSAFALLATVLLAREAFRTLEKLDKTFHVAWSGNAAAAPVDELLAAQPPVPEPIRPEPLPTSSDLVFQGVTFRWPGSDTPALRDLSFTLEPGQCVAVVGPSGAGKSTLAALLLRFITPEAGCVTLGGVDIAQLCSTDLYQRVSGVFQHSVLLHGSLEDNLRMGAPHASSEALAEACRLASLEPWVASLEQGLATPVGEGGNRLSGGQRQRVAIARAWLKGSPILLLDEATANVDVASEAHIGAAIERLRGQRSLLVIAHRLATVRHADRILVLDQGRLVESGDHRSLLARNGLYARLWALQHEHEAQPQRQGALA